MCRVFQAKVKPNKDKSRTYTVTYVPKVEGVHKVMKASVLMLHPPNITGVRLPLMVPSWLLPSFFPGESAVCWSGHRQESLHSQCSESYG